MSGTTPRAAPPPGRLAVWARHCRWALRASAERLLARPFGTGLTMLVLGLALALPLALALLLGNVQQVLGALGDNRAVSVFLDLEAVSTPAAAEALATRLRGRADVAAVQVKSPAEGLAELATLQGFDAGLADLGYNPLPWVLLVEPAPGDAADTLALATALRALPETEEVQDEAEWRERLQALLALGRRAFALLAALLVLAVLMVVGQTVRQDVRSRHREISVLELAGASPRFVRRPYLYAGALYGVGAGIVAVLLVLGVEALLAAPVHALTASYGEQLQLRGLGAGILLATPLAAAALGALGARLVTGARRHARGS